MFPCVIQFGLKMTDKIGASDGLDESEPSGLSWRLGVFVVRNAG
jgi:hypothetical protein